MINQGRWFRDVKIDLKLGIQRLRYESYDIGDTVTFNFHGP